MTDPMKTRLRERVARKMMPGTWQSGLNYIAKEQSLVMADAAISEIAAFLEEPTEEMIRAGFNVISAEGTGFGAKLLANTFRAMLRTALAGGGG